MNTQTARDLDIFLQENGSHLPACPTHVYRREYNFIYTYFNEYVTSMYDYHQDKKELEAEIELGMMADFDPPNISTVNYLIDGFLNSRGTHSGLNITHPILHKATLLRFIGRLDLYTDTDLTFNEMRTIIYPTLSDSKAKIRMDKDVIRVYQLLRKFLTKSGYYSLDRLNRTYEQNKTP